MKKTLNRVLAAAVAIPVAAGQLLAISASAAVTQTGAITVNDMMYVSPTTGFPENETGDTIEFTQESTWNTVLNDKLGSNMDTITLDAKAIVNGISSTNYYASVLKDIVAASANPTASMTNGVITITGEANLESYLAPQLEEKFASKEGYENFTLNTDILKGVTYTATITTDFANSKSVDSDLKFTANGQDYTIDTATQYMNAIYADMSAQIQVAVDQKVAELAAQYGMTEEEVRANADFDISGDLADLESVTDGFSKQIDALKKKLDTFKTANIAERTYATANEMLAAVKSYAEKNGIASAANMAGTVDGLVANYGSAIDNAVSSINTSLTNAGVNVQIAVSASDVAAVLNGGSDFTVSAANGTYATTFVVADDAYDKVVTYVEEQVAKLYPDKEVESVTTTKNVSVTASAEGAASFDTDRDVVVVLKDKTTTETSDSTATTDSSATTGSNTTATTASGTGTSGSASGTATTASSVSGGTDTSDSTGSGTTATTASGTGTSDTTGSGTTATTGSGTGTSDSTGTTGTTGTLPTDVVSVAVELLDADTDRGIYFSQEDSFDAADLIKSVTLTLSDGTTVTADPATKISFVSTPGAVYDAAEVVDGKKFFKGEIEIYYTADETKTPLAVKPVVAVALKGDTDLDGEVTSNDAYETLMYWSNKAAGLETVYFTDGTDILMERLAFYVSDIDTESKSGIDTANGEINSGDAYNIVMYWSYGAAGYTDYTWDDVIKGVTIK